MSNEKSDKFTLNDNYLKMMKRGRLSLLWPLSKED